MKNINEDKIIIQEKLKDIMKLAKEVGVLSENYATKHQLEPIYIVFNESGDEMKILKGLLETYGIAE